ncbi:Putative beta-lactamase-inhibitor-like, PepSY-like [Salegentibacter echinorum]|uniref:Putative beta-lactamase-inhibitor-like, PepSY-like n=1 Tax=Salegentibacter echinorum TaxID=1073325 RepID=A0A1M5M2X7_SALEC|nr:PepSY-like domain-containing protein [Salegentibacter echinorum]SHG71611.1 Putative beta-lactamase-inhibitor-like, PepSY-like [Salegentibacter echinorum]
MKNLKILSLAAASCFTFYACSDDDDNIDNTPDVDLTETAFTADTHVKTSSLPQPILDYITANYPDKTIREVELEENNNYEVELLDGTELIFNSAGEFLGVDDDGEDDFGDRDIAASELPQNIKDFLEKHYAGIAVEEAEIENNGNYEVELENDVEIIFDADGNFLGQAEDESGYDDSDDEDIAVADLPQVIQDYIADNYPDQKIIEAEREDDGFEVNLNNGVELTFDTEGNFLEAEDNNGDDDDDDND